MSQSTLDEIAQEAGSLAATLPLIAKAPGVNLDCESDSRFRVLQQSAAALAARGQPVVTLFGPACSGKSTLFTLLTGIKVPSGSDISPCTRQCLVAAPETNCPDAVQRLFPGAKFGEEGLQAIGKVGPRAFTKIIREAGEHSSAAVKLAAKYGERAVWVVTKPRGLAIFLKYGEEGAAAVMNHPGVAEEAVERLGVPAARALNAVSGAQARRIGMMIEDGTIKAGEKSSGLLDVVAKSGDEAMEFIWKHKGALTVTATLTAFLKNPEPFIQGVETLVVETVKPIGTEIAKRTNWTPVMIVVVALITMLLAFRIFLRRRRKN